MTATTSRDEALDEDVRVARPFVLDVATMTEVVEAEWMPLVRLAALLLGDRGSAEDTVQQVCEAVWRIKPDVADREHLGAYLRTAVVNRSRSLGRRRLTAKRHLSAARPDHEPGADTDVLAAEDQRLVRAALSRLPARQREVLVLRYWARLSEAEIAATLGVPAGTVKSSAHRALSALRISLRGQS